MNDLANERQHKGLPEPRRGYSPITNAHSQRVGRLIKQQLPRSGPKFFWRIIDKRPLGGAEAISCVLFYTSLFRYVERRIAPTRQRLSYAIWPGDGKGPHQ